MNMNCLRNSRSVFSRLMVLRRYCNPMQPSPAPRSRSDVLDSIRGLFFRPAKPAACCRTPAPSLPAAFSRSQPSIHRARSWYRDPWLWKVAGVGAGAVILLPYATRFAHYVEVSDKETVPYTNRSHRVIHSPKFERELGDKLFEKFKKKHNKDILSPSDPNTVRVRHILSDIIRGIQDVFPTDGLGTDDAEQGNAAVRPQTGHLCDLKWEVIVIRNDKRVNAHSYPGGKIVMFTGLLNSLETDAEIAAILAHEAAHVVARHPGELAILTPPILKNLLPFYRRIELEADLIGMMLLAAAGFDPRVAPEVYPKLGKGAVLDDYIGTHPTSKTRSRVLSQGDAMKEALQLYNKQVSAGKGAN
ncbi:Mitochondrial metalloendopeptidase OMA1 [Hordeum vulgare]|nr:Mitochondrial metalloendopeptidase OMA1 [Hordeum vulgare]